MFGDSPHRFLARLAVALVFLVFGFWETFQPDYWVGFVPPFALQFGEPLFLVRSHGAILFVLGLAFNLGFWVRIAALLGTVVMAGVVVSLWLGTGFTDLLVRDAAILLFVFSLVF